MPQNAGYSVKQISDVAEKLDKCEIQASRAAGFAAQNLAQASGDGKKEEALITKVAHDGCKAAISVLHGLTTQLIKHRVFDAAAKQ